MNYISHLQFGENSVKIRPKIGKVQILMQIFRVHVMQHVKFVI